MSGAELNDLGARRFTAFPKALSELGEGLHGHISGHSADHSVGIVDIDEWATELELRYFINEYDRGSQFGSHDLGLPLIRPSRKGAADSAIRVNSLKCRGVN